MKLGIVYHMPFWRAADGTLHEGEGSFARYVDSLAPYFDEVHVCAPVQSAAGDGTRIRSANVVLAPLPYFAGPFAFYTRVWRMIPPISRFVRAIDVLNLRIPTPAAIVAYAFARRRGTPIFSLIVSDLRALLPFMPYRGIRRALWRAYTAFEERNVQRIADHSLAFANGDALALKHSRGGSNVIEIRTTTIDRRDIAERDDACERGRIRILTVSRLDPRKGLRILPAALQRLVCEGVDATIDIIGPTAGSPGVAEQQAIEGDARARRVGDRVRLVGAVPLDALLGRYREYDLFVLPTLPGEGIPRVLLEAMAAGLPVVTTRVAGIPSLVVHEQNGLLVDEPTADGVSSALLRLVRDAALRRRLIAGGYATARAHTLPAQAAEMMAAVSSGLRVELRPAAPPPAACR